MNEIKIIHEFCAEDRARLDRLAEALEKNTHNCESCVQTAINMTQAVIQTPTKEEPAEEPAEQKTPATTQPEEEKPAEVKEAPAEEAKPSVTPEQIQQKVVQLCAGFEGKKKPAVRAIINAYGAKVSDLKDQPDKWDEVWTKLTALEAEA